VITPGLHSSRATPPLARRSPPVRMPVDGQHNKTNQGSPRTRGRQPRRDRTAPDQLHGRRDIRRNRLNARGPRRARDLCTRCRYEIGLHPPDDIPAHHVKQFTLLVITTGWIEPDRGDGLESAFNTLPSSGTLGSATVVNGTTECTTASALTANLFASPAPVVTGDTQRFLLLVERPTPTPKLRRTIRRCKKSPCSRRTDPRRPGETKLSPASSSTPGRSDLVVVGKLGAYVDNITLF